LLQTGREDGDLLGFRDIVAARQKEKEFLLVFINGGGAT